MDKLKEKMRKEKALQEKVAAMRAKKENVCRQRDALKTELSDDSTRSDFESSVTESTTLSVWRRWFKFKTSNKKVRM